MSRAVDDDIDNICFDSSLTNDINNDDTIKFWFNFGIGDFVGDYTVRMDSWLRHGSDNI